MSDLFPTLTTPIVPDQTPYTGLLVWLHIDPLVQGTYIDASASLSWLPYRTLANGVIDVAPETMRKHLDIASAIETSQLDPAMGQAIAGISAILQAMLAAGE